MRILHINLILSIPTMSAPWACWKLKFKIKIKFKSSPLAYKIVFRMAYDLCYFIITKTIIRNTDLCPRGPVKVWSKIFFFSVSLEMFAAVYQNLNEYPGTSIYFHFPLYFIPGFILYLFLYFLSLFFLVHAVYYWIYIKRLYFVGLSKNHI